MSEQPQGIFDIPKEQQKVFIDNFVQQANDVSRQVIDQEEANGTPAQILATVGQAMIRQLHAMRQEQGEGSSDG